MPARSINFVGSINRKSCCIPSFLLAKRPRRTSNQRVHKYCIALSPERHHGPWHTAVFTGRSSHLPPVTRKATASLITLSLSPSRGGSIVTSLYSCRPKNGGMRGNARQRPKHDEYCVTSFGPRRPWHFGAVEGRVAHAT